MTSNEKGPVLPQMKKMLGRAAANQIDRQEALGKSRRRNRAFRTPVRVRLLAMLAVATAAAVVAVSAGAFDRSPVAPQLAPAEAGVKPGVVPGETTTIHGADGEVSYGEVSPCIKSDPSGYSDAELGELEWCFHQPGEGKASDKTAAPAKEVYRQPNGKIKVYSPPGK
jgi:hypothetical protein